MPFNYDSRQQYQGIDPRIIKGASKSPFQIAGETMTTLNDNIDNRAFERDIRGVQDLGGLSMLTPTTDKQRALMASKQGVFDALAQQESRALQNQLAQGQLDMLPMTQQKMESDMLTSQLGQQEAQRAFDIKQDATKQLEQGGIYTPDKFSLQFGKDGRVVEQGVSPTGFNALSLAQRIQAERHLDPKGQSATFDLLQEKNDLAASANSSGGKNRYSAIADPITGQIRIYDKQEGEFTEATSGGISKKSPTKILADGREVIINENGDPWKDSEGNFVEAPPKNGGSQLQREKWNAKQELAEKKLKMSAEATIEKANIVLDALDKLDNILLNETEFSPSTGMTGAVSSMLWGTEASNAEGHRNTILANVGFEELKDMKAASPTGGALGSINASELKFLQSVRGSLSAKLQNKEQRSQIKDFKRQYSDILLKAMAYDKKTGEMILSIKKSRPNATSRQIIDYLKAKGY